MEYACNTTVTDRHVTPIAGSTTVLPTSPLTCRFQEDKGNLHLTKEPLPTDGTVVFQWRTPLACYRCVRCVTTSSPSTRSTTHPTHKSVLPVVIEAGVAVFAVLLLIGVFCCYMKVCQKQHFNCDFLDPLHVDLHVNTKDQTEGRSAKANSVLSGR